MSVQLPNGSIVEIASGYGDAKTVTALNNAAIAEARVGPGHGIITGEYFELTSGWSRATNRIFRAAGVGSSPSDSVDLEGFNTLDTTLFPAGSGIGSLREISGWTQIQQILSSSSDGGEQQFLEFQFLEDDAQKRIPTTKTASGMTLSIADDITLPGYTVLKAANDDREPRAIRITLPAGGKILLNAYVSVGDVPTLTVNEVMALQVTLSLLAGVVRYAE